MPDYNAVVEVVPVAMTPDALLDCFDEAAVAVRDAVAAHRRRGARATAPNVPGQYALDLVADEAALRGARQARRCAS